MKLVERAKPLAVKSGLILGSKPIYKLLYTSSVNLFTGYPAYEANYDQTVTWNLSDTFPQEIVGLLKAADFIVAASDVNLSYYLHENPKGSMNNQKYTLSPSISSGQLRVTAIRKIWHPGEGGHKEVHSIGLGFPYPGDPVIVLWRGTVNGVPYENL